MTRAALTRAIAVVFSATVVMLLVAGCGQDIDGTAVATGRGYRANVTPQRAQDRLSEQDQVRRLDPCGFIDSGAINAIGRPWYVGAALSQDECEVRWDRNTTPNRIGYMTIGLSVTADGTGSKSTISGRTAYESDHLGMCSILLHYAGERGFHYTLHGSDDVSSCPELRTIVTASAPLLSTRPMREASTTMPKTKAWTLDPCDALNAAYPSDQRFYMVGLDPFSCDFWLGTRANPDDSNRNTITYFNIQQTQAAFVPDGDRRLQIAGINATEHTGSGNSCTITAYVGVSNPFPTINHRGDPEPWIEVLEVRSHQGCDAARRLAADTVKAYQRD
ncbi:hypothetical protein [Nocardia sp. NPDC050710]|uniref:hypothetical protein n=1 Tax=Nocardia sp. NPDC050710 TaxID=3157220 RepID=UPI0033EAEEFC